MQLGLMMINMIGWLCTSVWGSARYFVLLRDQINVMGKRRDDKDVCNTVLTQLNPKWALSWQMGVSKVTIISHMYHIGILVIHAVAVLLLLCFTYKRRVQK